MKIKPSYCKFILHGYFIALCLVSVSLFLPDTVLNYVLGLLGPHSLRICDTYMERMSDHSVFCFLLIFWMQAYPLTMTIVYLVSTIGKNYTPFGVLIALEAVVTVAMGIWVLTMGHVGEGIYDIAAGLCSLPVGIVCVIASQRGRATEYGSF